MIKTDIQELFDRGYSREQIIQALLSSGDFVDEEAAMLFVTIYFDNSYGDLIVKDEDPVAIAQRIDEMEECWPARTPPRGYRRGGRTNYARGDSECTYVELSDREMEVMRLLVTGVTENAIGCTLGITRHTVRTHIAHSSRKLNLRRVVPADPPKMLQSSATLACRIAPPQKRALMSTIIIPLADLITDPENPIDLAAVPEAEALERMREFFGFLSPLVVFRDACRKEHHRAIRPG